LSAPEEKGGVICEVMGRRLTEGKRLKTSAKPKRSQGLRSVGVMEKKLTPNPPKGEGEKGPSKKEGSGGGAPDSSEVQEVNAMIAQNR